MNKTYPAVVFVAQHGRRLAVVLAAALVVVALVIWYWIGSPVALLVGVPAAAALWALVRVASEVVEVVAETLLPR